MKVLHHSDVSSTLGGTIICCFYSLPSSSDSGAEATHLDGASYVWLPSLTYSLNVPSKQLIPMKMSLKPFCIFIVSNLLALLSASLLC